MLYLISAPPRTGKTLKVIEFIFERLNEGRVVYTNIIGIKIPGVISIQSLPGKIFDWRDLPNDSVVVFDEAHEHPAFNEKNTIKNKDEMAEVRDIGTSLLLHGHFGFDIYLITQRPSLLHGDVLSAVSVHYVMRRKFGLDRAIIWEFGEAITTWSKSAAQSALIRTNWKYPKHLYNFYVSSEKHNVKKTFPLKYMAFALIPIALFANGARQAYENGFMGLGKKDEIQQTVSTPEKSNEPNPNFSAENQLLVNISKCIDQFNLTEQQCREMYDPKVLEQRNAELQASTRNDMQTVVFDYDPNNPYGVTYQPNQQPTDFPRFKNAIVYNGKCTPYSQQGTVMHGISSKDCFRLANGDRPFDYFAQPQPLQVQQQQPIPVQSVESQPDLESIAKHEEAKRLGLI